MFIRSNLFLLHCFLFIDAGDIGHALQGFVGQQIDRDKYPIVVGAKNKTDRDWKLIAVLEEDPDEEKLKKSLEEDSTGKMDEDLERIRHYVLLEGPGV